MVVVVQGRCQYKPQLTSIETKIYALYEYVPSAQRKFPYFRIMVNGVDYHTGRIQCEVLTTLSFCFSWIQKFLGQQSKI